MLDFVHFPQLLRHTLAPAAPFLSCSGCAASNAMVCQSINPANMIVPSAVRDAHTCHPVAVGGVGGSGTRLIAGVLQELGFFIGDNLNQASDALWFTLLFKRAAIEDVDETEFDLLTRILVSGLSGAAPLDIEALLCLDALCAKPRPHHPVSQLRSSADSLVLAAQRPRIAKRWGWKEPNTHVVIERLWQRLPDLRYVHVVRNGLDMAYSRNQNQLELWGPRALGENGPLTPARSLRYWCQVHQRMQLLLECNRERMYWLDYDALCRDPRSHIPALLRFLGFSEGIGDTLRLEINVQPPKYPAGCLDGFSPEDLMFVRSLGYPVA